MKEKNRLFKNKQNEIDSAKLRHELFKAGARYCQEHQLQVFNKVKKMDIEETIEELEKLGHFYETQGHLDNDIPNFEVKHQAFIDQNMIQFMSYLRQCPILLLYKTNENIITGLERYSS